MKNIDIIKVIIKLWHPVYSILNVSIKIIIIYSYLLIFRKLLFRKFLSGADLKAKTLLALSISSRVLFLTAIKKWAGLGPNFFQGPTKQVLYGDYLDRCKLTPEGQRKHPPKLNLGIQKLIETGSPISAIKFSFQTKNDKTDHNNSRYVSNIRKSSSRRKVI